MPFSSKDHIQEARSSREMNQSAQLTNALLVVVTTCYFTGCGCYTEDCLFPSLDLLAGMEKEWFVRLKKHFYIALYGCGINIRLLVRAGVQAFIVIHSFNPICREVSHTSAGVRSLVCQLSRPASILFGIEQPPTEPSIVPRYPR